MTSISKCHGGKCPLKEHCRRYTDIASDHQSYIMPPYKVKDGIFSCQLFWGKTQDGILNQLKDIVSGKLNL